MPTIAFVVDGFNLYHSLEAASDTLGLGGGGTRWLNLDSLFSSYRVNIGQQLGQKAQAPLRLTSHSIAYFSAFASQNERNHPGTVARQQAYIDCLQATNVAVVMGRFKEKELFCSLCKGKFKRYEEKETDVAIALHLVELAVSRAFDVVTLVSGDTDLAPALRSARRLNPALKLACLFPFGRKNNELARLVDFSLHMSAHAYAKHQFPDPFTLPNGAVRTKPPKW